MTSADRLAAAPLSKTGQRRSGRTSRMIRALPANGSVVVVHCQAAVGLFREMIREMRGSDVAKATRVIAAATTDEEELRVRGIRLPIFRDHFVDEHREHLLAVAQAWKH